MTEFFQNILPYKVLASHVLLVILFLAVISYKSWGRTVVKFISDYAIHLSFLVALGAVLGSLFYSEVIGFEACVLCWWQRVFLYPIVPILGIALWKKDRGVFRYAVPLALIAAVIGVYQVYSNFSGFSLLPCTAAEGACSKIYVKEFGYITIPVMSLTVSLYILLIAWAKKVYLSR